MSEPKMSLDRWIAEHPQLSRPEKLVAFVVKAYRNGEGRAWPSLKRLSRNTGYDERHLRRIFTGLMEKRVLEREVLRGRGRSNSYKLFDDQSFFRFPVFPQAGKPDILKSGHSEKRTFPSSHPLLKPDIAMSGRSKEGSTKKKSTAQASPSPSLLAYRGTHLYVTEVQDKLLGEAFPWVERQGQYRKMDSWLEANPERRPKNAGRFLHNWLSKIPPPGVQKGGKLSGEELTRANVAAAQEYLRRAGRVDDSIRGALPAAGKP